MNSVQQKETILINVPIETVWNFIEDPNNLQLWNPKVQRVTAFSNSGKSVGSTFGILYMMSNKANEMRGEVTVREPMSRLTFRYSGAQMERNDFVEEGFLLLSDGNTTILERTINFSHAPLPWWAKIIMRIIFTAGKPVEESYLVKLKESIEKQSRTSAIR